MSSKVLLVGYCPSHSGSPERPLDGPGTGHRLAKLCGLSHEAYLEKFDRVNLHYDTPLKRDRVTRRAGEASATKILRHSLGRSIILLGCEVRDAFDVSEVRSGEWLYIGEETRLSWIPHPSGLNRWYNETDNTRRVEKFLRDLS